MFYLKCKYEKENLCTFSLSVEQQYENEKYGMPLRFCEGFSDNFNGVCCEKMKPEISIFKEYKNDIDDFLKSVSDDYDAINYEDDDEDSIEFRWNLLDDISDILQLEEELINLEKRYKNALL